MPIIFEQNETHDLIRLEGEINIASAAELKSVLVQALDSGKNLRVDLQCATQMDITALQILWAAEHKAIESRTGFALRGCVPEALSNCAAEAGFERFPAQADRN